MTIHGCTKRPRMALAGGGVEGRERRTEVIKKCRGCDEIDTDRFSRDPKAKDGLRAWCKTCWTFYMTRERQEKRAAGLCGEIGCNAQAFGGKWACAKHQIAKKAEKLRSKYGIGMEAYGSMLASQGGRCAICKTDSPGKRAWHVDHCHRTGKVRGLLCMHCNTGIGHLRDSRDILANAIEYLGRAEAENDNVGDGVIHTADGDVLGGSR